MKWFQQNYFLRLCIIAASHWLLLPHEAFTLGLLSSHWGLAVVVIDWIVFLADQLVGLLVVLDDRVAHFSILTLQLFTGEMLHDASAQRVPQHVGGGAQTIPEGRREGTEKQMNSWDLQTRIRYFIWDTKQTLSAKNSQTCLWGQTFSSVTLHYASITFVVVGPLGSLRLYSDI